MVTVVCLQCWSGDTHATTSLKMYIDDFDDDDDDDHLDFEGEFLSSE